VAPAATAHRVPLLDRRLVINTGKGGVGKSVTSAAMALLAARQGRRTLLIQLDAKDRISEYLGARMVDEEIREVEPNLFCVNIIPQEALREYVLLQVKLEAVYKIVFENRFVNAFLKAVPALNDLVMIGKVEYHVRETLSTGEPAWDIIIVDAPPTGHGMFFLSVPTIMAEAARTGPIRDHSLRMARLLADPARCAVNLVSLPEEMPVTEAIDADRMLRESLNITPTYQIINRCSPSGIEPGDEELLGKLTNEYWKGNPTSVALKSFKDEISLTKRRREHAAFLEDHLETPILHMPDLSTMRFGRDETLELADHLETLL